MHHAIERDIDGTSREGGKARFVAADLSRADDVRRLAAEAGPADSYINGAVLEANGGQLAIAP